MSWPLTLFRQCEVNSNNNSGTYILLDKLFLPNGSMPAQKFPREEDCMVIRIEDGNGAKLQMNCYGRVVEMLRNIPRETVIHLDHFAVGMSVIPPMYPDVNAELYGYINDNGSVSLRGPQVNRVYTMNEVMTHLGRFTLELVRIDETVRTARIDYTNTFWTTSDGQGVMITAYRDQIERLEEFQLEQNTVYCFENAVPYPNSPYAALFEATAHFTIGPATTIRELQI